MGRARRHQTLLARLALALLVLIAELAGRSLTHRVNIGRHVEAPSYSGAEYYPVLLAAVKVGVALLLARLAWRFAKARSVAAGAQRLLHAHGHVRAAERVPRIRVALSPRLWLCCFVGTSLIYLLQTDVERVSATGEWPVLAAWLHTSALPVFAVLSVVVALVYGAVARWFADYEHYARTVAERASKLGLYESSAKRPTPCADIPPRGRFGVAFEVRPPPVTA